MLALHRVLHDRGWQGRSGLCYEDMSLKHDGIYNPNDPNYNALDDDAYALGLDKVEPANWKSTYSAIASSDSASRSPLSGKWYV
jgi:hypothetical protein